MTQILINTKEAAKTTLFAFAYSVFNKRFIYRLLLWAPASLCFSYFYYATFAAAQAAFYQGFWRGLYIVAAGYFMMFVFLLFKPDKIQVVKTWCARP